MTKPYYQDEAALRLSQGVLDFGAGANVPRPAEVR